jgi:hypothetical protein
MQDNTNGRRRLMLADGVGAAMAGAAAILHRDRIASSHPQGLALPGYLCRDRAVHSREMHAFPARRQRISVPLPRIPVRPGRPRVQGRPGGHQPGGPGLPLRRAQPTGRGPGQLSPEIAVSGRRLLRRPGTYFWLAGLMTRSTPPCEPHAPVLDTQAPSLQ